VKVEARLVQQVNPKTHQKEYALVSKKSGRVLKWFGAAKPSDEVVKKEERRVHFWESRSALYPALSSFMLRD
jgi:hypothetical protein